MIRKWFGLGVVAASLFAAPLTLAAAKDAPAAATSDNLYSQRGYDPARDPAVDLEAAIARATASNKHILIVVGGDWCVWCTILDRYLAEHADVRAAFAESFVVVEVNWSRENRNAAFLGNYPEQRGYPAFLILERDGAFVAAQDTELLEQGRSYSRESMLAFARSWSGRTPGQPS
ncbi:MAG: thioredoxin family protein [Terricaulis sp.]